ncbi:MAG: ATP synthase F0 subunit C [Eubacteriaceae bacterium]|jgi:F-type H+-transporting ATPase subunit c|nr:ATP synthase F0 subunit C [Eubacteriaceae bacterium]
MSGISSEAFVLGLSAIGAALAMFGVVGVAIGQGLAAAKSVESIARQPEAQGDIFRTMIVGMAISETTGIFCFIIAIVLLLANPLIRLL